MLNQCNFIGNVGKEPEIRTMNNGNEVANFSLGCSESWTDKNTGEKKTNTTWINVVAYGGLVQIIKNYVEKGTKLYISGKFNTRKWQDQNGNDRYSTEIVLQGFDAKLVLLSKPNSVYEKNQTEADISQEDDDIDDSDFPF